jgi:uncharacterized phage protein (TIGR02220 family)
METDMSPKIHSSFWRDPAIGRLCANSKMAMLWLITNSGTNVLGVSEPDARYFAFETGLHEATLEACLVEMNKSIVRAGAKVWLKNYIEHQFGRGDTLLRNKISLSIRKAIEKEPELREAIFAEYPELADMPQQEELLPTDTSSDPASGSGRKMRAPRRDLSKAEEVLTYLNAKAGRNFQPTADNLNLINARLSEVGNDVAGVKQMVDRQCAQWLEDAEMAEYLRPSTLFRKGKFPNYYEARARSVGPTRQSATATARVTFSGFEEAKRKLERLRDDAKFITDPSELEKVRQQIAVQERVIQQWNSQQGGGK